MDFKKESTAKTLFTTKDTALAPHVIFEMRCHFMANNAGESTTEFLRAAVLASRRQLEQRGHHPLGVPKLSAAFSLLKQ